MAPWVEVLGTAFLLQLLALPGEKGQLVIAALATRYDPYRVVAGAATAFGAWTAVEILVGEALTDAVATVYLDALTATLFVAFAAMILYSQYRGDDGSILGPDDGTDRESGEGEMGDGGQRQAGEPGESPVASRTTDGAGVDEETAELGASGDYDGGYAAALSAMGVAEFGDKTQLVTIGLAVQYGAHPAIWVGEMLAIVPVSLLVALVFHRTARLLNRAWVHYAAAATFLLFAADIAASYALGVSVLPL
ncbi:TMEM165/GDT1 family protein [Natronomonas salina]|nr:TMEM165/GDT1 family protein [Natronomonas salina]